MKEYKILKRILLFLLILTLSGASLFLVYIHFFAPEDRNCAEEGVQPDGIPGQWFAELSMTDWAVEAALGWLQEIEDVSVTSEDLESRMKGLTVRIDLTPEQIGLLGGSLRWSVSSESYESCEQRAYEAFAGAFRELVAERLRMEGYTGSVDEDAIEALVEETFGMSTVSYLRSCGLSLLPSQEELQHWSDNGIAVLYTLEQPQE